MVSFFFSSKGVFPKICGHPTHTTLFFLQMSSIPERSRSKTSTALTVSYNLLHHGSSTSPFNDTSPLSPIFMVSYKRKFPDYMSIRHQYTKFKSKVEEVRLDKIQISLKKIDKKKKRVRLAEIKKSNCKQKDFTKSLH